MCQHTKLCTAGALRASHSLKGEGGVISPPTRELAVPLQADTSLVSGFGNPPAQSDHLHPHGPPSSCIKMAIRTPLRFSSSSNKVALTHVGHTPHHAPRLGHRSAMVVPLQNHSGTLKCTSCLNAAEPRHTVPEWPSTAPPGVITHKSGCSAMRRQAPPPFGFQVNSVPLGRVRISLDYPPALPLSGLTDVRAVISFPPKFQ